MSNEVLAIIERAVLSPDIDVGKMKALLDMQLAVMDKQAEMDFNIAMSALRTELPPVFRNKKNTQTDSSYADLDAIKKIVDPLLVKHGFFDRYEEDYPAPDIIGTTCIIVHKNGHSKINRDQFNLDDKGIKGSVNKTSLHAAASSMTYGQRLSLCRALGVRISEDDDGNSGVRVIDDERIDVLKKLLEETSSDELQFLKHLNIENLKLLPMSRYVEAKTLLTAKKKRANAKA